MMRSIAVRLAVTFALVAAVVFALSGFALYRALGTTLERQQEADLRELRRRVDRLALRPALARDRRDHEQVRRVRPQQSVDL